MPRARQLKRLINPVWAILVFLTVHSLVVKASDYLMDTWSSDNGLPDSSVTAITQTPDGYLWIGTFNGLARFDGVRFVTYDPVNTPEIKNARITGLFVDRQGTLWINTYDGSLTSLRNGVFTHEQDDVNVISMLSTSNQVLFTLSGHRSIIPCRIESKAGPGRWKNLSLAGRTTGNNVKQDGSGAIWYLVKKDLYRMTGTNSVLMPPDTGWRGSGVNCLSTDDAGHLWIGTDEGIYRWNGGRFEDQTPMDEPTNVNVVYLFCAGKGCWIFGDGKVRQCVNRQWVADVAGKDWRDLAGTFALDLNAYEDRAGGLWFTHPGAGLFHLRADGTAEHLSTLNGLPDNATSCWFEDREGNVWVGMNRGGLARLRKKMFQTIDSVAGLASQAVSSICEDGRSNIWISTFSGGLYRWQAGKAEQFDLPDGAYNECFFSSFPDAQGRLWLSAGREDLYVLDQGKITRPSAIVHGIKAILVDRQGRTWFGKAGGLSYLDGGKVKNVTSTNHLDKIRCLAEDSAGGIWVGNDYGDLFHYTDGELRLFQPDDGRNPRTICSLLSEKDGTLWVGTFRGGLLRFKDGKFTRYTRSDGLPDDIISQILDDGMGRLWIGSHKGILYIPKPAFADFDAGKIGALPCIAFGLSDGLPALECSGNYQPACWRDHAGRLWFATVKGPVSILPRELMVNRLPPPVVIEEISVNGRSRVISPAEDTLVIPPGERQMDFQYTAMSFMAPEKVAFRYQIKNFDDDWVDGGTKRSAHYGPLRPGKYVFRVIACNNDGVWNKTGASIHLVLRPYFWQTWWFRFFSATAGITAIVLAVLLVEKARAKRKLERLEQAHAVERERQRIARDIHDDLGAGLTQILLQSSLASRETSGQTQTDLNQISDNTRELVRKMDEIVWAVTPEKDTLESLATYVSKFVQEFCASAQIRCRMDLPARLPETPVTTETRHGVFLAIKEALNNVAKHAGASEVWVQMKLAADAFSFIVTDNGAGLQPGGRSADGRLFSGRGLENMARRLEKIGGACRVSPAAGGGTRVELTVRLPIKP